MATVLLYGLGRSGLAAGRLLARQGHRPVFFDQRHDGPDIDQALDAGWRRVSDPLDTDAATCIAAPGVPIDHPDLVRLRAAGIETIGEVEWVARTVDAPIVGVTGTAGKGTVTRWLAALLRAAGIDAVAGGNLDPALAAVAEPNRWLIVELSSFQLERCPTFHPRIAAFTVLGRDHLDRHGDVASYHALKRKLLDALGPEDLAILNARDPVQRAWADATPARVALYDAGPDLVSDHRLCATVRNGRLELDGVDLGPDSALRPAGRHQRANLLAAALAAQAAGATPAVIAAAIPELDAAPDRHELIAARCGVRFVNDSIATRELAVAASLEAAVPPVVWIAGGRDKGSDPESLRALVTERVAELIGIGESGPELVRHFHGSVPGLAVNEASGQESLRQAVRHGAETLRRMGGGTVLLAPLATSFDQFADYAERGRAFRQAVHELLKEDPWTGCC